MAVLITGGSGLVGSYTTLELLNGKKEDKIIIYDLFPPKKPAIVEHLGKEIFHVDGNILDFGRLLETIKKYNIDGIIHTALLGNFNYINANPMNATSTNFNGALNIFELARIYDLKVVFTSSGAVYGEVEGRATEDLPIRPSDMYGMIKATGELVGEQYARTYGIDYVATRLYFIYGQTDFSIFRTIDKLFEPPVSPVDVISQFLSKGANKEGLKVDKGGDSRLDFTYAKDSAYGVALAYLARKPPHRAYNVSTGKAYSLKEISDIINRFAGHKYIEIGSGLVEGWPLRAQYLDNTLAREELGYSPRYSIENGICEFLETIKTSF